MRKLATISAVGVLASLSACKASDAAEGVASAGQSAAGTVSSAATSLVNVNLSNVLNDLAVQLRVDKANIPVNAQIPITIAANICGVSINVLSVSGASGTSSGCTAVTTSPQLTQVVGQQLNAGSGAQTGTTPTTSQPPPTTTTPQQ
ncbi:MAG TPA: hypothetical protein VJT70_05900 [Sphingomicrobium sp.]|nr:hypothetical protein [Sphingomicrobium sp.]